MSLLPILLDLADNTDYLLPSYYLQPTETSGGYLWPTWSQRNRLDKELSQVSPIGKDGFQVCLDVAQFKPSELSVKVKDNAIVVEGKHEEREDNLGYISRHFVRRYALPKGYESEKVISSLSSDGVLTVSVPKPPEIKEKSSERIIQIQQTGPAHLNIKENSKGDEKQDENNEVAKKK